MKKTFKRLLTCVSALTIFAASLLPGSAIYLGYDLENPAYQAYVDSLISFHGGITPDNDEIAPLIGDGEMKYIYGSVYELMDEYRYSATVSFERAKGNTRLFSDGGIYWHILNLWGDEEINITEEDVKSFIADNNLNAEVTSFSSEYREKMRENKYNTNIVLDYDENISAEEVVDIVIALNKQFGFKPYSWHTSSGVSFSDEVTETTEDATLPSLNIGTVTIAGDIDLNNEQGISDIVTLTKYNTSPDLYPITDPTALANADMNRDGAVNTLDASILIEIALGTYESAV